MDGLSWTWMLALGLPILAAHLFSIALTKALQSHSRSLLEERCEELDRPHRARKWNIGPTKLSERPRPWRF